MFAVPFAFAAGGPAVLVAWTLAGDSEEFGCASAAGADTEVPTSTVNSAILSPLVLFLFTLLSPLITSKNTTF